MLGSSTVVLASSDIKGRDCCTIFKRPEPEVQSIEELQSVPDVGYPLS